MNRDAFDEKWKEVRDAVKERWNDLTDEDLNKLQGRYEQFVGLLQEKYGHTREKVEDEIQARLGDWEWQETADATKERVVTAVKNKPWHFVLPTVLLTIWVGLRRKAARA